MAPCRQNISPSLNNYPSFGTPIYDLDTGQDNYIKLNYSLNVGSAVGDLYVYIPDTLFSGGTPYVYVYSKFGVNFPSDDGFEEWSVLPPPPPPVTITQWRSVRVHGGSTPLPIILDAAAVSSATVEPRSGGIRTVEVDFSASVTLSDTAGIGIIGQTTSGGVAGSPVSYSPSSAALADSDTLRLTFNAGVLPDRTCYTITLPVDIVTVGVVGDRDVKIRTLESDASSGGVVRLSDALATRARAGTSVASNPQFDLNLSGAIDLADALMAKAAVTSPFPSVLCP